MKRLKNLMRHIRFAGAEDCVNHEEFYEHLNTEQRVRAEYDARLRALEIEYQIPQRRRVGNTHG